MIVLMCYVGVSLLIWLEEYLSEDVKIWWFMALFTYKYVKDFHPTRKSISTSMKCPKDIFLNNNAYTYIQRFMQMFSF